MSSTDNRTAIIKSWKTRWYTNRNSFFQKCLESVGVEADWKANDNELDEPKKTEYELQETNEIY